MLSRCYTKDIISEFILNTILTYFWAVVSFLYTHYHMVIIGTKIVKRFRPENLYDRVLKSKKKWSLYSRDRPVVELFWPTPAYVNSNIVKEGRIHAELQPYPLTSWKYVHGYTTTFHADYPTMTCNSRYFIFIMISVRYLTSYYAFVFKEEHVFEIFSNFDFE